MRRGEAEALEHGLVDIVAGDDFESVVTSEAQRMATLPTATLSLIKEAIRRGRGLSMDDAMDLEEELMLRNLDLLDAAEGISAFLDKRPAHFGGR